MQSLRLSDAALALLRRRLAGEWVGVTEENRPLYRELVGAGMMEPLHTFAKGSDGHYRLTEAACRMRDGIIGPANPTPSCAAAPAPRG